MMTRDYVWISPWWWQNGYISDERSRWRSRDGELYHSLRFSPWGHSM